MAIESLLGWQGHLLAGLVLGLIMGSFVSMASYRWLKKQSWWGRSCCTACGRKLGPADLVPILSYVFARGHCSCGHKISIRYPIIEGLTALLSAGILVQFGFSWLGLLGLGFVLIIALMIVIDWENFIIPNALVLWLLVLGLVWRGVLEGVWYAPLLGLGAGVMLFLTAFLAAFVCERINETESLGGGDLKLLMAAGPWVGFPALPALLLLSGVFGVLTYLIWKRLDGKAKQSADVPFGAFPYGPAICLALYICVLFNTQFAAFFGF